MSKDDDFDEFFSKVGTSQEAKINEHPEIKKLDQQIRKAWAEGRERDAIVLTAFRRKLLKGLAIKEPEPDVDVLGPDSPF